MSHNEIGGTAMAEQFLHEAQLKIAAGLGDERGNQAVRLRAGRRRRIVRRAGALATAGLLASLATVQIASALPRIAHAGTAQISSSAFTPAPNGPGTRAIGVGYSPATVLIPASLVAAELRTVSADGATYTFSSATGPLARLKKGTVMLLQGLAVRIVTSVSKAPAGLVVLTTPAAITDLIRNGTLTWNTPIDFAHAYAVGGSAVPLESLRRQDPRTPVPVAARFGLDALSGGAVTLKGKTDSYSYAVSFKSAGKAVGVDITLGKSSPVDLSATISGTLDNLSSAGSIAVKNDHLSSARMVANGLHGKFKLSYSVKPLSQFGLGSAGGIKITLPAELTVPFSIDGVPLFIGIKTAFFASVGFSGFGQAVTGSYTIDYDGNGGFSTSSSGATNPLGALQGLGEVVLNAANAVNTGPVSVIFGAQIPQLELGLGVKGLNVAGFVTLIADTGVATFGPGCDTRGLQVQASAGAEAKFFGLSLSLGSATLFQKQVTASYPAGCGVFPGF
ncbi:MAG: hypothetical protein ACLP8S_15890 [Solirubrobacteraceae bacterium]